MGKTNTGGQKENERFEVGFTKEMALEQDWGC